MAKSIIRRATINDLPALMGIALEMHQESPRFSRLRFSEKKMTRLFMMLLESPDCLLVVAEQHGDVIGGIAGMITPHWFSDDLVANDYGLFLLPEYRGGMAAARLVKEYVNWASARGVKMIQLGISTGVHTAATVALYQALGLKQFSVGFEV